MKTRILILTVCFVALTIAAWAQPGNRTQGKKYPSAIRTGGNLAKDKIKGQKAVADVKYSFDCMEDGTGVSTLQGIFGQFEQTGLDAMSAQITDDDQSKFGDDMHDQMVQSGEYTFVTSGSDYKKINKVFNDLLKKRPNPSNIRYSIYLVESDEVNAFTVGGHIYVYTGIMKFMHTESELAAVIGHEIGHNEKGHIKRMMQRMNVATNMAGDYGQMAIALQQFLAPSFDQQNEVESDFYGIDLAYSCGYDACKGPEFWQRMSSDEGAYDPVENWMRSHPYSSVRRSCLLNHLQTNYSLKCD